MSRLPRAAAPDRARRGGRRRPAGHLDRAGCRRAGLEVLLQRRLAGERADRLRPRRRPARVPPPTPAAGGRRRPARPPRRRGRPGAGRRRRGHRRRQHQDRPAGRRSPAWPGCERYVGGHPMAGSERSGPLAASAALFDGRPWAVTPHPTSDPARWRWSTRWCCSAGRCRCGSRPRSTTARWPAPPTCRTCSRSWWRAGSPTPRRSTWRCRGRACATSPGSPPATPRCGSRS